MNATRKQAEQDYKIIVKRWHSITADPNCTDEMFYAIDAELTAANARLSELEVTYPTLAENKAYSDLKRRANRGWDIH